MSVLLNVQVEVTVCVALIIRITQNANRTKMNTFLVVPPKTYQTRAEDSDKNNTWQGGRGKMFNPELEWIQN